MFRCHSDPGKTCSFKPSAIPHSVGEVLRGAWGREVCETDDGRALGGDSLSALCWS